MKKCGFVIRVSTDRQAQNKEGSLKNQLQRLKAHIDYKNVACGEDWVEAGRYVLSGVSGKDSFRSPEFAQLFEDMRTGKVNTVICTALDRISRSVKDFLNFFEILTKYNVEFVCLKQNYDTTSSQGKLFITIMMALAEFEREQTSERTKEATLARAERGLWNGGQLLGYDLDPIRKGYLIINEAEKAVIQFAFKKYLECGSLLETARTLNRHGYRTKSYISRRNKTFSPKPFVRSSLKHILMNYAYIGKKEVNKKRLNKDQTKLPDNQKYRVVNAVWDPVIDEDTFFKVQCLIKENTVTKHNLATKITHTYILNGGLLWCEKCGAEMEGTCGVNRTGTKYYYYKCKNKDCRFKIPAEAIEKAILEIVKKVAIDEVLADEIIKQNNEKLQQELPQLKQQKALLDKELAEIKKYADGIMQKWVSMADEEGSIILKEKLNELSKRRKDIEEGIRSLELMIDEIKKESISREAVMVALQNFLEVFEKSKPYQQKELVKYILNKVKLSPDKIEIALYGSSPSTRQFKNTALLTDEMFVQTSNWLPRPDSNQRHGG